LFKDKLSETEINEMKEYKYIYFLGKDFNEKIKNNDKMVIKSARERIYEDEEFD
jgi:hypothetical protein